jgi:hypothetical protein
MRIRAPGLGIAIAAILAFGVPEARATLVTFDSGPLYYPGYGPGDIQGLHFETGFYQAIWPSGRPGADNGTPAFINGYSTEVITATGGGSFTLNSFDLGLSYYTNSTDDVTITYNYAGGGSSSETVTLGQTFTHFDKTGLPALSSWDISTPAAGSGYIALDNVSYNAPEPSGILLAASGLIVVGGLAWRRRKASV